MSVATTFSSGAPPWTACAITPPVPATTITPEPSARSLNVDADSIGIWLTAPKGISEVVMFVPVMTHTRSVPSCVAIENAPLSAVVAVAAPSVTVRPPAPVGSQTSSWRASDATQTRPFSVPDPPSGASIT